MVPKHFAKLIDSSLTARRARQQWRLLWEWLRQRRGAQGTATRRLLLLAPAAVGAAAEGQAASMADSTPDTPLPRRLLRASIEDATAAAYRLRTRCAFPRHAVGGGEEAAASGAGTPWNRNEIYTLFSYLGSIAGKCLQIVRFSQFWKWFLLTVQKNQNKFTH